MLADVIIAGCLGRAIPQRTKKSPVRFWPAGPCCMVTLLLEWPRRRKKSGALADSLLQDFSTV